MLQFFRNYQKFFFLFTTLIIVVSFVFFGTFQVLTPSRSQMEETAFITLDHKKVNRRDFFNLVRFLGLEGEQNPFNDGVISESFLETGLGAKIFAHYQEAIGNDLKLRAEKEKHFVPYVHPEMKELSAKTGWELFAPEILIHLPSLQANCDLHSSESFYDRIQLFLAQRKFPGSMLKQFLFYKSQDFEGCNLDPKFYRNDLSLFGYKNLTDWFGPTFVEKIAEVILHGAALAKQRGYAVFRDEVVTDLMMRCHAITDANKGQIQMNGSEFYYAALKRMQLSEESLISIWKNVLLFRRLMQDVGNGVWMDTTPLDEFFGYAGECAIVEVYSLPSPFCFTTMAQWQEFETYLDLVGEKRDETLLPIAMIPLHQVEEKAPELISSKYTVFIATAEKKALEAKIGLKQMWKWESSFEGWEAIIQRFPDLREIEAPTQEARLEALDGLGDKMRALIDRFAREEIVNAHPEWLTELLAQSESTRRVFYFRKGQTASPLDGITDVAAFVKAIESSDTEKVEGYTQDKKIYFNLKLEEKGEKKVLSFVEASKEGVLSEILEKKLRGHYLDLREKAPSVLQTETGKFRPFSECKEIVANHYFTSTHHALEKYKLWTPTQAWFLPYLEHKKNQILAGIEEEGTFEWSLSKKTETITRATPGFVTLEECQALEEGDFSEISVSSKEGPYFYKVIDQRRDASFPLSSLLKIESVLANELKTHFIEDLLKKIQTKEMNFISQ